MIARLAGEDADLVVADLASLRLIVDSRQAQAVLRLFFQSFDDRRLKNHQEIIAYLFQDIRDVHSPGQEHVISPEYLFAIQENGSIGIKSFENQDGVLHPAPGGISVEGCPVAPADFVYPLDRPFLDAEKRIRDLLQAHQVGMHGAGDGCLHPLIQSRLRELPVVREDLSEGLPGMAQLGAGHQRQEKE